MKKKTKEKDKTWSYIKKCAPYFWKEKKSLILLLSSSIIGALMSSFFPALTARVLTLVSEAKSDAAIKLGIICLGLMLIMDVIYDIIFNMSYIKIEFSVSNSIKKKIINAYFKIENKILINTPSGLFISRVTGDPEVVTNAFSTLRENITTILTNILVVSYIFYIHWSLGLIALVGSIALYKLEEKGRVYWNAYRKRRNKFRDINTSMISESVRGIQDVKLLDISQNFEDRIAENIDSFYDDTIKSHRIDNMFVLTRDSLVDILTVLSILLSIIYFKHGIITMDGVMTLFMYRGNIFLSTLYLARSQRNLKEFDLSAERIFDIIDGEKYSKEKFGNRRVTTLKGNIEFKKVCFSYGKRENLKNISFKIEDKENVAIVGRSGAGKTTILNLLNKTYEVSSGEILIDGNNINDLDKFTLRNNIAVISQQPYIFNMTIKENLLIVKKDASDKELENVCKICELHDFIETLPDKYDTLIGESGINLSGGERQRLAIARALLKRTNIILFDEATSALDNETQANIQKAINNISDDYTMIIVAHRLSTIKDCQKIIVLDDGKVVGIGNHKQLYKSNEIYKSLYLNELQK